MLHLETVEPRAFSILKQLMELNELNEFSLVGGTALSLLYGHRKSEDLDLFCAKAFDNNVVTNALEKKFKNSFFNRSTTPRFGIFGFIDELKVDIIRHRHPLIRKESLVDGIRMFSPEDIIAMNVQAVLGRAKKKDFWDIAELLKHYSVEDFIHFHKEKYAKQNLLITVPQALTYFADAEEGEEPISLKNQNWQSVKNFIAQKVSNYLA
ncbi:MAG TPA: nucleotidyl transferase AbiEii/AbiGii toxin family protein [Agriterribacter sp.]|nr:nucleotidyl transferase AbiEii/AbiGii toxin family protein [Agriterribacter sp.]